MDLRIFGLIWISCWLVEPAWSHAQDQVSEPVTLEQISESAEKIKYKSVDGVDLNLHLFRPAPEQSESDGDLRRPVIVFFFGGGWVSGTPQQFYRQAWYLSRRGMVAVCAEYRIKSKHQTGPRECVKDGKSAIRYLRRHAQQLGIDPNRIVAAGGSAGGHIAAATATVTRIDEPANQPFVDPKPQALILFNPVLDNGPGGWGHEKVKDYWQDISPLHNLAKPTVPTLFMLGDQDKLIPVETAKKFQQRVESLEGRCELLVSTGSGHGYFNRGEPFIETLEATDRFLVSLKMIEGPPRVQQWIGHLADQRQSRGQAKERSRETNQR